MTRFSQPHPLVKAYLTEEVNDTYKSPTTATAVLLGKFKPR